MKRRTRRGPSMVSSLERLEPRLALAAQFIISEFMASNTAGIVDVDGSRSDWIEVQNIGDSAGNLAGHYLTDDAGELEKWRFPSTPIAAGGFIRVFASAKDRAVAGQELHTNFALEQNGEYLGLVGANGSEILHDYDQFPEQLNNVSYGVLLQPSTEQLIIAGANVRWHVPATAALGTSWTAPGFDDASWVSTPQTRTGVGHERGSGYQSLINANTETASYNVNATAYMRIPFDVDLDGEATVDFEALELKMRFDDGFVAYLNGVEVARRNAPGAVGIPPAFNADATVAREGALESVVETIDISSFIQLLQPGGNVLAIHGLNDTVNDSDFLILPELIGIEDRLLTENYFTTPTPGAANIPGTLGFVADTAFSVDRGFFESTFQVEISSPTPGAQIRYTLDGTPPTATTGLVYNGPIPISTTTTLRAAAFKAGLTPTNVDTQTYIKLSDVIRQSGANLPAYANWGHAGPDWEMDQDLVGPGRPYSDTIIDDLKSVPTLSLVMPWNDWFGSNGRGIYISGTAIERAVSAELINPDGSEGFQLNAAVEIQGGTSDQRWKDDKLSMQLKFKSAYGPAELDYDFFGGDAVDRFDTLVLDSVLNYSWLHHQDGSQRENAKYIQDQFVADLQLATGGAAPHGRFVHLYLNGLYWGMYYVHERPDENFAAAYLGGDDTHYDIIKHASNRVVAGSNTNYLQLLNLAGQNLTIDANYQAVLNKLDVTAFIDYMIVNFYAGNTDWAHHNWYASFNRVDTNGKWHFHSWDAEHVLKHHQSTTDVTGKNNAGSPTYLHQRLATNAEYRLLFADRVHKHFFNDGVMTPANAAAAYQARMNEVDRAIVGESVRWGDNGRATPYTRDTDWFPDNRSLIIGYFPARTNVVKNQLLSRGLYTSVTPPVFSQHGGTITPPFSLSISSSSAGTIYYTIDGSDPRLPGGAINPTAQLYGGALTLNASTRVKARVLTGGNWSALTEALFLLPEQPLRIVEVNYAPVGPPAGSPYVAGDFEFVELLNTGSGAINLNGIQISEGVTYTFGNQSLGAGQRIVVSKNVAAFQSRYGTGVALANGTFTGSLNNAGEELKLLGPFGETIQNFAYDNSNDWPGRAGGNGSTLEIINPLGDSTDPENWRSSTEYGGSPGTVGIGSIQSIVVNEVLTHTDPPLADAIELYNPTSAPINVGGWYLSDSNDSYQKFRIPTDTVIAAGGYLVFDESQFGQGSLGFGLNSAEGDDVYLLQADPTTGKLLNFIDHVEFAAAANGESFGRWPNGEGSLYPMQSRTLGTANNGPRIGPVIISELMYNAQSGNDDLEYVELTNITDAAINLAGWKFDAGIDFTFGATTLPARGTLVVLRFDPANAGNAAKLTAFCAAYPSLPQNAQLVGGYAGVLNGGVLDNGGETVRLVRPDTPQPGGLIPYLLVDEVDYNDQAPWPISPDGTGTSLTRASRSIYGNEPTNWSGESASPGVADLEQPLTTITGSEGNDTYYVIRSGAQLHVYENTPPIGQPTYASELSALGSSLTIDALGGDDSLIVDTGTQGSLGLGQLIYNAGAGVNTLFLQTGSARIDSAAAGGTLNTTVQAGARLSTGRLSQNGLALEDNSRVTLLPDGQTSVISSLTLGSGATLDIGNNAVVLDYTGASPVATIRQRILAGRGGPGLGASWNGAGITSSAVAQANTMDPESRSIGYTENVTLPLGAYTTFRGVPVDMTSILIADTRTGDANLDGFVNDDDATVVGASYAPTTANAVWALGDFEYNGFVDDDDATLLGVFYNPAVNPPPPVAKLSGRVVSGERWLDAEVLAALATSAGEKRRLYNSSAIARPSESGIGRPSAVS
ncbi:MAG: lamin tail domain-containing protein [Pirellulales bacterium]